MSVAELALTVPQCPLCGAADHRIVARYPELVWVRCACGLIYKRWQRSGQLADDFYEGGYFGEGEQGRAYTRRAARRVAKSMHQIRDVLNHAPPGPLLDVGCSMGYTLRAAAHLGLPATGTDISEHAVATCRALGYRALPGRLDRLPFADGEFGIVTMKHVLEHTPDPRRALAEVRRVLRPGGGLFIAIPHGDYHKARRRPQSSRYFLPAVHGVEHFVYYTPRTLTRLLTDCGFTVARVHPALLHRVAPPPVRVMQALFAPWRGLAQFIANRFELRKEFWVVALRD
jgi:SAM-dependent methyltransferase